MSTQVVPARRSVTGVVLAGGRSRRFGTDKAVAVLEGRRMVDRVVEVVRPRVDRLVVVANDAGPFVGLEVIPDRYPGAGPLGGVATALCAAGSGWCLVIACDCPLIEPAVVDLLLERMSGTAADVVTPNVSGLPQPLVAGYSFRVLPVLERRIERGQLKMVDLFPEVQVDCVSVDEISAVGGSPWSFFNVNTPEEFSLAERYLRGEIKGNPPLPARVGVQEPIGSCEEQGRNFSEIGRRDGGAGG